MSQVTDLERLATGPGHRSVWAPSHREVAMSAFDPIEFESAAPNAERSQSQVLVPATEWVTDSGGDSESKPMINWSYVLVPEPSDFWGRNLEPDVVLGSVAPKSQRT